MSNSSPTMGRTSKMANPLRIAYANATYQLNASSGGNVHVGQFISNAVSQGHEVWSWSNNQHPAVCPLPSTRLQRMITLRNIDVIYTRIEDRLPGAGFLRWSIRPYKQLIGNPITVWEFNTVPEYGLIQGKSSAQVEQEIEKFRRYSHECDLAVCVSNALADYVRSRLNIRHVITIPNGSDPELFHPDVPPVYHIQRKPEQLNVVWMGSADLAWHNFKLLKDTAQLLWESNQSMTVAFHIIGQTHAVMREMPPNVYCYGTENYQFLPQWLTAMDVGLCIYHPGPADYSSPLKVFDYMSSGLTVVGTEQPQLQEIFGQLSQLDLLAPANDPKALATILLSLASHPERVRYQGEKSRQLVLDFYNWSRAVRDAVTEIQILRDKCHRRAVG